MTSNIKTAFVCGGTSGLGKGAADSLSLGGARVIRGSSRLPLPHDGPDEVVHLDFRSPDSIDRCVETLRRAGTLPDILVVNGPGPGKGGLSDIGAEDWADAFEILWTGPLALVMQLLPPMVERGWGRIVWVTSMACERYMPDMAISTSLRVGLHGLVRNMSAEYAAKGITVNAIAPGYHATDRLSQLSLSASLVRNIPAGRLGSSDEFGQSAAFLASGAAAYITGQVLLCDGGWSNAPLL